jgi:hypothetical protein
MRWDVSLLSPSVVVRPWQQAPTPATHERSVVLRLGPDADGRRADVAVESGEAGLRITVLASGGRPGGTPCPEWYYRDHIVVHLDPGHGHAVRHQYAVAEGLAATIRGASWIAPGETAADFPSCGLPDPPAAGGGFSRLPDGRRWFWLEVPRADEWWRDGAAVGLQIKVGFGEPVVPPPLVWPVPPSWASDTPLVFGDLYERPPAVAPEELAVAQPAWGPAVSRVRLRVRVADGAPRRGRVVAAAELPGEADVELPAAPWQATAAGEAVVDMPVVFPHRAKWSSDVRRTARLALTVRDEAGRPLWAGRYPFGFDCGIIVRERYGAAAGAPRPPPPAPRDPLRYERQRAYLLARLPAYVRRTTRDGAPSDFFLDDPEGLDPLDLMAPDALDRAAGMLARRFPEWQEALAAAALWAYHPLITTHSAAWSRVAGAASNATIPRLDGCFCSDVARLLAALVEKIGARLGVPLAGHTMGLRGHLTTLVVTPLGPVVVDGMLGHWYPSADGTRLATLDEMRADAAIVGRVWYQPRAHGHEFFFGVRDQIVQRWQDRPLVYPAGGGAG